MIGYRGVKYRDLKALIERWRIKAEKDAFKENFMSPADMLQCCAQELEELMKVKNTFNRR